jgi:dihydropyrimidine dehydrogenase (NAD+) subunit PreA
MAILETEFLGIRFSNPFMLASGPPSAKGSMIKDAFQAGWGGVVTKTICLEPTPNPRPRVQIIRDGRYMRGMVNIELISEWPIERWEKELDDVRASYPDRPIIASIMGGGRPEDWQDLVRRVEKHGVNGFEMNVSCPNFVEDRGAQLGQDPESLAQAVGWVRAVTHLPIVVKLTPNVTDIVALARVARESGADAITATNTLSGMAGIDLETLAPLPTVNNVGIFGGYSGPGLKPVALRCVASIAQGVRVPLIGCGGIGNWKDAAEFIAVGAGLLEICTAVMWNGYGIINQLCHSLTDYLDRRGMADLSELRGKALPHLMKWPDLDLSTKLVASIDDQCNGCGKCVGACAAGGYQAIMVEENAALVDIFKCDGCGLCVGVCPLGVVTLVPRAT